MIEEENGGCGKMSSTFIVINFYHQPVVSPTAATWMCATLPQPPQPLACDRVRDPALACVVVICVKKSDNHFAHLATYKTRVGLHRDMNGALQV